MQTATQNGKSIIDYHDFPARLILAMLAAHLSVSNGEDYLMSEYLSMQSYFYSLLGNFVISFSIIQLIYLTTCHLDISFGWEKNFIKRSIYQLLFGVLIQTAVAIIGAVLYFYLFGIEIKNTRYFKFILLPIVLMISALNLYYAFHYYVRLRMHDDNFKKEFISIAAAAPPVNNVLISNAEISIDLPALEIAQHNQVQPNIPLVLPEIWKEENILLLYIKNSITYVVTSDGSSVFWLLSIKESMKYLSPQEYFKIRPSCVIKRSTIEEVKKLNSLKYVVILGFPFQDKLIVSARNTKPFLKWLNG